MKWDVGKSFDGIMQTIRKNKSLLMTLSVMVVFVTTYLLILPAITLDEDTAKDQGGIDVPAAANSAGGLTFEGEGYTVEAAFDAKAGLPDDTQLAVTEIEKDAEDYGAWHDEALKAIQESKGGESVADLKFARFYDISLVSGDQALEPEAPVDVNISYDKALKAADADHVRIIHFGTDKKGNLEPEVLDPQDVELDLRKGKMRSAAFAAESFSVYGIVYTVDFLYEVNGKEYTFSMQGEDSISLKGLLEELHVYEYKGTAAQDDLDAFMADITDVTFSDEELMAVLPVKEDTSLGQLKLENGITQAFSLVRPQEEVIERNAVRYSAGDWVLISLLPFNTDEKLQITLVTGETVTIHVTDAQDAVMNSDGTVQTISNPAGTTIDLFDYWVDDSLKDHDGRNAWPGYYDGWSPSDSALGGSGNEAGINEEHALKFSPAWEHTVYNGTKDGGTSHNVNGRDGLNSYTGNANPFQGIVGPSLQNGYPVLTNNETIGSNEESLAYLFDPSMSHNGKASYSSVDQLMYVDREGYYTYDSRDYAAAFNEETGTFTVTEQTSTNTEIRGFWPFGTRKFWSGMHINTQFSMPADGMVLNPSNEYKPMQFEFSGDDDTWLYVDGVLVGDGGGIHNRTEIDINFAAGTVTVTGKKDSSHAGNYEETKYLDDIFTDAGKYVESQWEDIGDGSGHKRFKAGTYHAFDMFYLERGGGESNLYIHYNLVSTADFTAHKSFHGTNEEDLLERDQFQFELIGLDGKYRSVPDSAAGGYVLVQEDPDSRAIMPRTTAGTGGAGTVASPYFNNSTQTVVNGELVGSQTYRTGVTEDGNINFGMAEISEDDMHEADEGNPPVYRYIIREIVPGDAVNEYGKTWAEATDEERQAGGFVKDDIIYDGTVYYMTGRVTSWTETDASGQEVVRHGISKTYYTDDTFTTLRPDTPFVSFVNSYNAKHGNVEFEKTDQDGDPLAGATFALFRDESCKMPAKMIDLDNRPWTATSDTDGKVSFENVRAGTYYMKETAAPEGYALNDTVYKVVIEDATDPSVSSKITILNDETQTEVTEIINTEAGKLKIIKKWLSSTGAEVSGETHSAAVHLYRKTDDSQVPESSTVSIVFHRIGASWDLDTGTTGNVVTIEDASSFDLTWHLGNDASHQLSNMRINGVSYSDAQNQDVDTGSGKVNWNPWNGSTSIMSVSDISSDMYIEFDSNCDWFSTKPEVSNLVTFVPPVIDTNPVLVDTITLSPSNIWNVTKRIGGTLDDYAQAGYDLPATDNNGYKYLYYIVELNERGEEIEIEESPLEGYILRGYSANNNTGVAGQGALTVYNQVNDPPTMDIIIKKVDINHLDETNPDLLKGAAFKLTKYTDATFKSIDTGWALEGSKTLTDAENEDGTFTLNGAFEFLDIPEGCYMLEETQYPDGYIKITDNPAFQVRPKENGIGLEIRQLVKGSGEEYQIGSTDTIRIENNTANVYVANEPGAALPSSGGPGTTWLYLIGSILLIGCSTLLVARRRMRRES